MNLNYIPNRSSSLYLIYIWNKINESAKSTSPKLTVSIETVIKYFILYDAEVPTYLNHSHYVKINRLKFCVACAPLKVKN